MRMALFLSVLCGLAVAFPAQEELIEKRGSNDTGPDPTEAMKVCNTFINTVRPSHDQSLGLGVPPALNWAGTFKAKKDDTFTGTLIAQPDRGFSVCVQSLHGPVCWLIFWQGQDDRLANSPA